MENKFMIFNDCDIVNKDYNLTNLNKINNNYSVYLLLTKYLSYFGVYICGSTIVCDLLKNHTKTKVVSCILDKDIPVENIGIIDQLYGFSNALINICLDRNEEREFAFWFNTEDKTCELEKLIFGVVKWTKKYTDFKEMMEDIRNQDSIDDLVEKKKLKKFYITFGQSHKYKHGDIMLDNNCVGVIKAESYEKMREIAWSMFEGDFATTYTEAEMADKFKYFPNGLVELN